MGGETGAKGYNTQNDIEPPPPNKAIIIHHFRHKCYLQFRVSTCVCMHACVCAASLSFMQTPFHLSAHNHQDMSPWNIVEACFTNYQFCLRKTCFITAYSSACPLDNLAVYSLCRHIEHSETDVPIRGSTPVYKRYQNRIRSIEGKRNSVCLEMYLISPRTSYQEYHSAMSPIVPVIIILIQIFVTLLWDLFRRYFLWFLEQITVDMLNKAP